MRASSGVMAAANRSTAAELRSVNAQLETLLREALARRGIVPSEDPPATDDA